VPDFLPDTPALREDLALHYDAIARMDGESSDMFALLRQRGLVENTLVVLELIRK
jgi:hypothetical protein